MTKEKDAILKGVAAVFADLCKSEPLMPPLIIQITEEESLMLAELLAAVPGMQTQDMIRLIIRMSHNFYTNGIASMQPHPKSQDAETATELPEEEA